jgi:hypothetical protein
MWIPWRKLPACGQEKSQVDLGQMVVHIRIGVVFDQSSVKGSDRHFQIPLRRRLSSLFIVRDSGTDREKHVMSEILAREQTFINSTSPEKIQSVVDELERLRYQILFRTPSFLKSMFSHLVARRASMNDQIQASQLIENGKRAIERDDIESLRQISNRLWDLMPATEKVSDEMRAFTGII